MHSSKYFFRKAILGRLEELSILTLFTLAFTLVLLPVIIAFEVFYYTLIPLILIIVSLFVFGMGFKTQTLFDLNKAEERFKKEQLINIFHKNPTYYKYVKASVIDVDEFITTMSRLRTNFKELDDLAVFDRMLSEFSFDGCTEEVLIHLLMNPQMLPNDLTVITTYIDEFHLLLKQYPYASNPFKITRDVNPKHIPDMDLRETRQRLYDVSEILSDTLQKTVEDYEEYTITDINEFINVVNDTLGIQVYKA